MLKRFSSIIFGLITGFVIIRVLEFINHSIYPPPVEVFSDKESIKAYVEQLPLIAKLLVLAGWALASLAGGFIATKIAKIKSPSSALIVGVIFMLLGVLNMITIPHPIWFWLLSAFAFIPMAYFGYLLAAKKLQDN
jgi:uncharacterized protein YacL